MSHLRLVSLDVGGTLVDHNFIDKVWNTGIPRLYARGRGISFEEAREEVERGYREIGSGDIRWYTLQYWFDRFDLEGSPRELLESFKNEVRFFPEVSSILRTLRSRYDLIVISNAPIDILNYEIGEFIHYFERIFSSITNYHQIRKTCDIYRQVCIDLSLEPCEVLHIGDSKEYDFFAPREAGMNALYLDRSGEETGELIINSLGELHAFLNKKGY